MSRLRFPYMETAVSCLGNYSFSAWKLQFPAWEWRIAHYIDFYNL